MCNYYFFQLKSNTEIFCRGGGTIYMFIICRRFPICQMETIMTQLTGHRASRITDVTNKKH